MIVEAIIWNDVVVIGGEINVYILGTPFLCLFKAVSQLSMPKSCSVMWWCGASKKS